MLPLAIILSCLLLLSSCLTRSKCNSCDGLDHGDDFSAHKNRYARKMQRKNARVTSTGLAIIPPTGEKEKKTAKNKKTRPVRTANEPIFP